MRTKYEQVVPLAAAKIEYFFLVYILFFSSKVVLPENWKPC